MTVPDWLTAARQITVLTGAGISTESGIPDFRGPQGVWTRDPEAEKLSTLQYYVADPDVRRRAWQERLHHPAWTAEPNAGHAALVDLERQGRLRALVTQNIDGLHGPPAGARRERASGGGQGGPSTACPAATGRRCAARWTASRPPSPIRPASCAAGS